VEKAGLPKKWVINMQIFTRFPNFRVKAFSLKNQPNLKKKIL